MQPYTIRVERRPEVTTRLAVSTDRQSDKQTGSTREQALEPQSVGRSNPALAELQHRRESLAPAQRRTLERIELYYRNIEHPLSNAQVIAANRVAITPPAPARFVSRPTVLDVVKQ